MFSYYVYGWVIQSDYELPMLVNSECLDKTVITSEGNSAPIITIHKELISEEILTKYSDHSFVHGETESWLQNNTCYLLVRNGNEIIYQIKEGEKSHPEWMSAYLLGWGMSMVGLQRGESAIHCSAVACDEGALLICGESGSGKSTLTAGFLANGYRLMADDMAMVTLGSNGRMVAKPAFPFQKLVRDAALARGYDLSSLIYINEEKDKFLIPYEGDFSTKEEPILGMIMIRRYLPGNQEPESDNDLASQNKGVLVDEPTGFNKLFACADNLFLRLLLKEDKLKGDVGKRVMEIAEKVPIYCIYRPDGVDTSREVTEKAFELADTLKRQVSNE